MNKTTTIKKIKPTKDNRKVMYDELISYKRKCESMIAKMINEQGMYGQYPDEVNEQIKMLNSIIVELEFNVSEHLFAETKEGKLLS